MTDRKTIVCFHCTDDMIVNVHDDSIFKNIDEIQKTFENEGRDASGFICVSVDSELFIKVVHFLRQHKDDDTNQDGDVVLTDWDKNFFTKNIDCFTKIISASICLDIVHLYKACNLWVKEQHQMAQSSPSYRRIQSSRSFQIDMEGIRVCKANNDVLEKVRLLLGNSRTTNKCESSISGISQTLNFDENNELVGAMSAAHFDCSQAALPNIIDRHDQVTNISAKALAESTQVVRTEINVEVIPSPIEIGVDDSASLVSKVDIKSEHDEGCSLILKSGATAHVSEQEEVDADSVNDQSIESKKLFGQVEKVCNLLMEKSSDYELLQSKYDDCLIEIKTLSEKVADYKSIEKRLADCEAEREAFKRLLAQKSIEAPSKRFYECKICGLYVSSQEFLVKHLKNVHDL